MEELSGFLYFFIAVLLTILIICYAALAIFLNNFNIDEKTFLKVVSNYKKLNSKNLEKIKAELNQLITNTSKGFLYTETIYKVKKNEK